MLALLGEIAGHFRVEALAKGVNVYRGRITCPGVAQAVGEKPAALAALL